MKLTKIFTMYFFSKFLFISNFCYKQGKRIGVFPKDKYDGDFFTEWNRSVEQAGFEKIDASGVISAVLAVKDDVEMGNIKKACELTSKIYSKYLKDQLVNIIDGEKVLIYLFNCLVLIID